MDAGASALSSVRNPVLGALGLGVHERDLCLSCLLMSTCV